MAGGDHVVNLHGQKMVAQGAEVAVGYGHEIERGHTVCFCFYASNFEPLLLLGLLKRMDTIDVPEFKTLPKNPEELGSTSISAFVDMLLTSLFSHAPAVLHAEFQGEDQSQPVVWYIRPLKAAPDQRGIPVATSDSCSIFRMALARFGHHYMRDQLYNGYSLLSMRQSGFAYRTYIYMSNGGMPGFWIKIYAALAQQ